ncbi:hypothetical protein EJ913_20395 [Azospirillum doebereinerae]|uniref:Terminase large subunit-like endonuclease domain-containing protein n=2 Tax=Azospirillum doebereinerae TaxID=92933 RepID=A0A433J5B1_9PROT|nr:hypothetical protein EJ913_20395 [Azospirillum doebereinerae]
MAPAIKELERAIVGRQFQHGGHEVLRWCFDNIQVETDRADNRQFSKGKARERIDGAVACALPYRWRCTVRAWAARFMTSTCPTKPSSCER